MIFNLITGSNRMGGNTEQIADYITDLLGAKNIDCNIIRLREYEIKPCGSCGECNTRQTSCAISDDMPKIMEQLEASDGIIYLAPVHGYGLAHPMQIFIERAGVGYLRFHRPLANKIGGCVITGRRYGHVSVFNQIVNNMLLNRMILVGSGYPTILQGGTPGAAMKDEEGIQSVRNLVGRMIGLARHFNGLAPGELQAFLNSETANERDIQIRDQA